MSTYNSYYFLCKIGAVDVKPLITHRYGFNTKEVLAGFEMAKSGNAVKVMFCF